MSKKGQDKKELIYKNAKALLYEVGYTNTTIKKIAEISEVPISLVHYYFKKKDAIVMQVYYDFVNNIDFLVYRKKPEILTNSILTHAVTSRIYYDIILNDSKNKRVYYEVLQNNSNYGILNKYASKTYHQYIKENHVIISDELFEAYLYMNFGARREFFIKYFEGEITLSIQEMVSAINGLIPRLLKLDQHYVDSLMLDSISIFDAMDHREVKFLV
ncbi:MAG: TetR/AcrR family transcriptional regulator [Eubacteriaceae bacterium]|nr:TetR/AcrR family transcriptional regulator [Eubacteriaceae bacterium]